MKFQIIRDYRSLFPVKKMCQCLQVSQSGYHVWTRRLPSRRALEKVRLQQRIHELYQEHGKVAGSPMITSDLNAEAEFSRVSRCRVARYMRSMGLRSRTTRKFVVTTDSRHAEPVAANLLNREFSVSKPDKVWVSDITYLKVGRKWHYLTVFIDLHSRMVVGWDLSASLERTSMQNAFRKAISRRKPSPGLMVHSDRGVQYASIDFRTELRRHGCVQSMSRKGNCWDNAVAESFFHTLKTQMVRHQRFVTRDEAEFALFRYIEVYYNRRRRHSANGWVSPVEFEKQHQGRKVA